MPWTPSRLFPDPLLLLVARAVALSLVEIEGEGCGATTRGRNSNHDKLQMMKGLQLHLWQDLPCFWIWMWSVGFLLVPSVIMDRGGAVGRERERRVSGGRGERR